MLCCCGLIYYFKTIVVMALVKKKKKTPPVHEGAPSICLYYLCPGPSLHIHTSTDMSVIDQYPEDLLWWAGSCFKTQKQWEQCLSYSFNTGEAGMWSRQMNEPAPAWVKLHQQCIEERSLWRWWWVSRTDQESISDTYQSMTEWTEGLEAGSRWRDIKS